MGPRKRGRAEMESATPAPEPSLLSRLRNMWEFSNIFQYIKIFTPALKLNSKDYDDIEDFENECIKAEHSEKLSEIGLAILKIVSSHRGLNQDNFDEFTRRQYVAKAPTRNPFGTEEEPKKFAEFDIFTKLRVLCQLSRWTFINTNRLREAMPADADHLEWRMNELGWDRSGRAYICLDDKRLYRRTDAPLPPPPAAKLKASSKKAKAAARASKRRKAANGEASATDPEESINPKAKEEEKVEAEDDGFGGQKWECICIILDEYNDLVASFKKSKDADEVNLHKRLIKEVLPEVEKAEEDRLKKAAKREKELLNDERQRTAKRSSRIASKQDRERQEREEAEAAKMKQSDLIAAKQDLLRQKEMEAARESRMQTREQRLKEREYKRILHEEELANLSDNSKKLEAGEGRLSERHLKAEMEKKKRELEKLNEEDEWFFDCAKCGVHGDNLDDGTHSVACEVCNVWQHSACLGISQQEAEKDDFHFVCIGCKRKEEDAKKPKIPALKFKLGTSSSPPMDRAEPKKRKLMDGEEETRKLPPIKKFKHTQGVNKINSTLPSVANGGIAFVPYPHNAFTGTPLSTNGLSTPSRTASYGINHLPHASTPSINQPLYQPTPPYSGHMNGNLEGSWSRSNQGPNPFASPYQLYKATPGSFSHNAYYLPNGQPSLPPAMPNGYAHPPAYKLETPNGHLPRPQQSSLLPPPNQSPLKQSSPPSLPAPIHTSSSPIIPPPLDEQKTRLAGLSPTKHSPPRPTSAQKLPSVLPPMTALQPSPQVQNYEAPVKKMNLSTEQIGVNGLGNGVVFNPPVANGLHLAST